MKTSNKLLLTIAAIATAFVIAGMVALRNDVHKQLAKIKAKYNYAELPVDQFKALDFSAHWKVNIRQGTAYKVEVAANDVSLSKIKVENIHGTLYFKVDTTNHPRNINSIHAKVTAPLLHSIKAVGSTTIQLRKFTADSLSISLEDSVKFIGKNNQIKHKTFKSSGNVSLQITDDTDM